MLFQDIKPGARLRGLDTAGTAEVVQVAHFGPDALNLVFRIDGRVAERLVYRGDEAGLELIEAGRAYAFDADGALLRLASEAYRIRLAHLFDPYLAVSASQIEALPHQITAVYGEMLPRQPLRFLLADDPGAGKTIMAGLLIKELLIRGDLERCLIVAPGSLVEQWQDEMAEKFGLAFDLLSRDQIEASLTGNPFVERHRLILRLDMAARSEELKAKLETAPEWDLVICDEAHRMAASYFGGEVKETRRHKLGKLLGGRTRNLLLMSATPHNGKESDFQLFMGLLDADRFEGRFREGVHKADVSDMMRRLIKEELYRFDGTPLFPERRAYTASYELSPAEADLYQAVTTYVREEMNRADRTGDDKRRSSVGFALQVLQRRLASSPAAIHRSLERRRKRLEERLREERLVRPGASSPLGPGPALPTVDPDDLAEIPGAEAEEAEEQVLDQATAALTLAELEAEIAILKDLEDRALRLKLSGQDAKWRQLERVLDEPVMLDPATGLRRKILIFTEPKDTLEYLDAEGERARDETVRAFHELYRKNPAEFPPETKEGRYQELLRISYPIHPELFDRLSKDWSSLANFQRTRGVLRFMANVVGVLWQSRADDPLITPARVPVANDRVRASVLYPLDPGFGAVIDKEVDGDGALPARMEANPSRRISQARAATRAARAVFLCSAPLVGQPNCGVNGPGLRLACAEPGDQLAIFGEAVRELTEKATYLYEEAGRYWFSTQPTLNRLAEDRAKAFAEHEVDGEIAKVLVEDARNKDRFARVFAVPDDPVTIDEAQALSLVILGPASPHGGRGISKSPATEAVGETLLRCRTSQRRFRNTLLFVAADEAQLANAREAMRRAMAWKSIVDDRPIRQQLTEAQIRDAENKVKTGRDGAVKAVRLAWSHVLVPIKTDTTPAGTPFELEHVGISSRDRAAMPVAVYDKVKADGIAKETLGAETFRQHIELLWPANRPHLPVVELADWFASFLYLPKLRYKVVLEAAVRDAVNRTDAAFAYADSFDPESGRYQGLLWARRPPELMPPTALLVQADVAKEQLTPAPPVDGNTPATAGGEPAPASAGPSSDPTPIAPRQPTRFYGSVEIDMVRPVRSFDAILNAVVTELQRTQGAKIKLTLEIEAEAPDGFADADIGVVRDNARQLKFKAESTGFEEQ